MQLPLVCWRCRVGGAYEAARAAAVCGVADADEVDDDEVGARNHWKCLPMLPVALWVSVGIRVDLPERRPADLTHSHLIRLTQYRQSRRLRMCLQRPPLVTTAVARGRPRAVWRQAQAGACGG